MIHIIIPTLDRQGSLLQTLESIRQNCSDVNYRVTVTVDANEQYYKNLLTMKAPTKMFQVLYNEKRLGWGNSINKVLGLSDDDYYFSASDDLAFRPGALKKALAWMGRIFPSGDGVLGINQENLKHFCPAAFSLVGRKFINRFPARQLYFPLYRHFCVDSELWHYAKSEKRFFFFEEARVYHRRFNDPCHRKAQASLKYDRVLWWFKKGKPELYWGNFNDLEFWKKKMKKILDEGRLQQVYAMGQGKIGAGGVT